MGRLLNVPPILRDSADALPQDEGEWIAQVPKDNPLKFQL